MELLREAGLSGQRSLTKLFLATAQTSPAGLRNGRSGGHMANRWYPITLATQLPG